MRKNYKDSYDKIKNNIDNYIVDLIYFDNEGYIDARNNIKILHGYAHIDKKKTYIGSMKEVRMKSAIALIKE
jgi:hypothetical protein